MIAWIVIGIILFTAFGIKVFRKLQNKKRNKRYYPNINTRKKRFRFISRFRHLEGVED